MSHLALGSLPTFLSAANSSSFALAHLSDTQPYCPLEQGLTPVEFRPLTKSPGYVLGEQLVKLSLVKVALRITSYFYSKLPSLSLSGAQASSTTACDALAVCTVPIGSYEKSCYKPEVTYLPDEHECEVITRCATMFAGLPPTLTSFRFAPGHSALALENNNGTLVAHRSREEAVNARLSELSKTARTPEALVRAQETIIGTLNTGDVITVNSDLQPVVISPEKWAKTNGAFSAFQRIAHSTGGIMGHAPSAKSLHPLMEKMSAHILKTAESSEFIDVAFVLDTTSSMEPYIAQVQNNLVQFLEYLQEKKKMDASHCRIALVEYRDKDDVFLNRVNIDFTSNFYQVQRTVRGLATDGGGDEPEAVLDALLTAKNALSWNPKAKRIVILIGDAPPQPKTQDEAHDETAVIAQYQVAGTQITVYPILSEKEVVH